MSVPPNVIRPNVIGSTEDTYMDDIITGADTIQAACELLMQLEEMAIKGGFRPGSTGRTFR